MLLWGEHRQQFDFNYQDFCHFVGDRPVAIDKYTGFILADKLKNEKEALYILGGSHDSQLWKFQKVARLYKLRGVQSVWIMHADGITAYDNELGRNLTEDEWTMRKLTQAGVSPEAIRFLEIEIGWFGTFSEARALAAVCRENRISTLLLVCAAYHAKRVEITFSAILSDLGVKIEIHPTDEYASMKGLIYEYAKKVWYETILIPFWQRKTILMQPLENMFKLVENPTLFMPVD